MKGKDPFPHSDYFLLGFVSLLVQVVLLREVLVAFRGAEIVLAPSMTAWLLGLSVGGLFVAQRADTSGSRFLPFFGPPVAATLQVFLAAASLLLFRNAHRILSLDPGILPPLHALLFLLLPTFFLCAAFCGVGFAGGLASSDSHRNGAHRLDSFRIDSPGGTLSRPEVFPSATLLPVSKAFLWESAGATAGGILFTFLLVTLPSSVVLAVAAGGIAVGAFSKRRLLSALLLFGFSILLFSSRAEFERLRWNEISDSSPFLETFETPFQSVALGGVPDEIVLSTNGIILGILPDEASNDVAAGLILSQKPDAESVLLLGHASTGVAKALLRSGIRRLDHVELDPFLVRRLASYPAARLPNDTRYRLFSADGISFLSHTRKRYDLVACLVGDPISASTNRYFTRDFFLQVRRILRPDGVLAFRLTSSMEFLGEDFARYLGSLWRAIREVFPVTAVSPGETLWVFAASRPGLLSDSPERLAPRFPHTGFRSDYFSAEHLFTMYRPERARFLRRILDRRAALVAPNTLLHPISYFFGLSVWAHFTNDRALSRILALLSRFRTSWLLLPLIAGLILLSWRIPLPFARISRNEKPIPRRYVAVTILFSSGLLSMGLYFLVLYSFQARRGILYRELGLLNALFMAGLASGSLLAHRFVPSSRSLFHRLALSETLLPFPPVLLGLGEFFSPFPSGSPCWTVWYGFLLFSTAVVTGFQFPIAGLLAAEKKGPRDGGEEGTSAAKERGQRAAVALAAAGAESADNLGAALGALLFGVLLIPVSGVNAALAGAVLLPAILAFALFSLDIRNLT
ncbi:MAG: hypothetical protein D6679_04150 [Candidatus Hydrogenedentota bacterium]|nr:MAG: hypothetical protein D6679_04150 [Candidatus Hydrogenedentota bacterium]